MITRGTDRTRRSLPVPTVLSRSASGRHVQGMRSPRRPSLKVRLGHPRSVFPCILCAALATFCLLQCGRSQPHDNVLLICTNDSTGEYGYRTLRGDTVIPMGKYPICVTDTFRTYALVALPHRGFVGIDRQERVLYDVVAFDNWPDEPAEGLFRIMRDGKYGYADATTGAVVIEPRFACAWPFENGSAKVSFDCTKEQDGEYELWKDGTWFLIDRTGQKLKQDTSTDR